ncbi:hypothetical protein WDU94_008889 [Cyamophila willieti]
MYDRISMRFPVGSLLYGFPAAEAMMNRERKLHRPPLPTRDTLVDVLHNPLWLRFHRDRNGKPFFREVIVSGYGMSIVFISDRLSNLMTRPQWNCHVDATFDATPNILGLKQLFTIHAVDEIGDEICEIYPTVYALMTSKSAEAYMDVLNCVRRLVPGFQPPGHLMSDFESALRSVFMRLWPNIEVSGCWFHYTQAIYRRVTGSHLTRAELRNNVGRLAGSHFTRDELRDNAELAFLVQCIMVLPLIPAELMEAGFACIRDMAAHRGLGHRFGDIFHYVQAYWFDIVTTRVLSIGHLKSRTNNAVESFYNELNRKFQYVSNPNFWLFIDVLMVIDTAKARTRIQVENRIATRRTRAEYGQQRGNTGRRPKGLSQDAAIKSARRVLETNPANFHDFFRLANHRVRGYLRGNLLIRGLGENMVNNHGAEQHLSEDEDDPAGLLVDEVNNHGAEQHLSEDEDDPAGLLVDEVNNHRADDEAPMEEDDGGLDIVDMYDVVEGYDVVEVYDVVNLGPEDLDEP